MKPRKLGPIPPAQESVNKRWTEVMHERYPNGEDALTCLNMLWLYFKDRPSAWHPAFNIFWSMSHATVIFGVVWKNWYREFKPLKNYIDQLRTYGLEENKATGRLEIKNFYRFEHALWIARYTARCPPSTFEKRYHDPDCQPTDPVKSSDLPAVQRWKRVSAARARGRLAPTAAPFLIEKEMQRVGLGEWTFDERRKRAFATGHPDATMAFERSESPQERFSDLARDFIARSYQRRSKAGW